MSQHTTGILSWKCVLLRCGRLRELIFNMSLKYDTMKMSLNGSVKKRKENAVGLANVMTLRKFLRLVQTWLVLLCCDLQPLVVFSFLSSTSILGRTDPRCRAEKSGQMKIQTSRKFWMQRCGNLDKMSGQSIIPNWTPEGLCYGINHGRRRPRRLPWGSHFFHRMLAAAAAAAAAAGASALAAVALRDESRMLTTRRSEITVIVNKHRPLLGVVGMK